MQRHQLTASILVLMLMVSFAFAEIPLNINYQARLSSNDTGDPVPDNVYLAEFRFYSDSTSGSPDLTRAMDISTHNGFFNAVIGGMEPLDLSAFGERIYMEVVIDGEVMLPRAPMAVVPYSAISQRVLGDIQTGLGSIKLMEPLDAVAAIEMTANIGSNNFKINWMEPLDFPNPALTMTANTDGSSLKFKFMEPLDKPGVEITAGNVAGVGDKASIKMFNPQPEPPAETLLEMNTTELGASFEMTGPQTGGLGSDITDPMLQIYTNADGAGINLSDEIGRYMGFEPSPFTPGGCLYLINPGSDDTNVVVDSDGNVKAKNGIFGYSIYNSGINNLSVGAYNNLTGSYSFGGGYLAQVFHNNCFVWADYAPDIPLNTTAHGQFLVRASGGVAFYTNGTMTTGVALSPGGSSWNAIVPPLTVNNSRDINGSDILARIEQLPIKYYGLNNENSIEHIGPEAGEFNSLFNTGNDDRHISALDQSGVALAGVQALINENREFKERITRLEEIIEKLNND